MNLEELLGTVESPAELLRNSPAGPNVYPVVPSEFTNWRDEQRSWRTTAARSSVLMSRYQAPRRKLHFKSACKRAHAIMNLGRLRDDYSAERGLGRLC